MSHSNSLRQIRFRVTSALSAGRLPGRWFLQQLLHSLWLPIGVSIAALQCLAIRVNHRRRRRSGPAIFIGRTRRLGDLVALEPISRQLLEEHPDATVSWLVEPWLKSVVGLFPSVRHTVPVPCESSFAFLQWIVGKDSLYVFHFHQSRCPLCLWPIRTRAKNTALTLENFRDSALTNLEALAAAANVVPTVRQPLLLVPKSTSNARRLPDSYLVMHGESADSSRAWQPNLWKDLALRLLKDGSIPSIVMIGNTPIFSLSHPGFVDRTGRTSLTELAEIVAGASMFVGIDSGPAHFANAYQVSGVILLGTNPSWKNYQPFDGYYADANNATIVRYSRNHLGDSFAEVLAAVRSKLRR